MSGIRASNTKPEMLVRNLLHREGFRFRLHRKDLPGKPDIVLPRYRAVIFVHGCFWHQHNCNLFKMPKTNESFWRAKLAGNRLNDQKAREALLASGWRVAIVWECAIRTARKNPASLRRVLDEWIKSAENIIEVRA